MIMAIHDVRATLSLCAATVAVGLALGSCSPADDRAAPNPDRSMAPPVVSALPTYTMASVPDLPLDPYFLSSQDRGRLLRALSEVTAECMRRAGVPMPAEDQQIFDPPRNERRYGITDAKAAEVRGYRPEIPEKIPDQPLSEAQMRALAGTGDGKPGPEGAPAQGCRAVAAERVTGAGSYPGDFPIVQELNHSSFELAAKDRRVVAAFMSWSGCMKERGFSYSDPLAPNFPEDRPSALEISTAVADVSCKERVNLVNTWNGVEKAYQEQLITRHRRELDAVIAERSEQLRKAGEALRK